MDTSETAGGLTIACVRPVGMSDDEWDAERALFEDFIRLVRSLSYGSPCVAMVRLEPDEVRLPTGAGT